jgi:neutral ceramidase
MELSPQSTAFYPDSMRLLACLLISGCCMWGAELRAGAAEVSITPPMGAPIAGSYSNRTATGVHDELHAKSLVFETGGVKVALVACDLANLPRQYSEEARRIIQQKTGIAPDHVMISATHTHTGPVLLTQPSRYNLEGEMKRIAEQYGAALPGKIADAVVAAVGAMKPARVRSGIGREDSLGFNRRYFMKDGTVAWNPHKLDPNIVRPAGPVDPGVPVVYVETPDGEPIAAYVNYAVHQDTTGGRQFSADYSYTLGKILRDTKRPDLISIFTIGCAGNVNHLDVHSTERQSGYQQSARIGAVLAGQVLKVIQRAPVVDIPFIRVSTETVDVPAPKISPQEAAWARSTAATFGKPTAAPFLDLVRAGRDIDLLAWHSPLPAEVQVIALGTQIAFVGFPGEMFAEFGLTMKQDSPYPNTIIAELANGSLGYIPNRAAYPEGGYEVVSTHFAPGGGEMLVDSAMRQLTNLFRTTARLIGGQVKQ